MLISYTDKHMGIHFHEPRPEFHGEEQKRRPEPTLEKFENMKFGFGHIIFDNDSAPGKTIATVAINSFLPSTEKTCSLWNDVRTAIGGKLSSIADADALIVDLRQNGGGDPNTVAFIMSYLLDGAPQHLLDFVDSSEQVQMSFSTIPPTELPTGTKVFGSKKPLFVLTTRDTISGGEDMAYGLQAFKRASAVIGDGNEATAGAANPITNSKFICEEEFGGKWWLAAVPNLKPVHEITGSNWEGIGVKSDIVAGEGEWVGINDAKEVATRIIVKSLGAGKSEL
jgi:C-terminal processing protease CtpA/Prc